MGKRVCCLYRVSSKGQVEKDDIPMQKQRCHEFAVEKGWDIVEEFYEKGISGYKVSAKKRDAVQEIQRDATEGKFDILLVFMFDRLGRKEDETPFIVEWFVKNGIEVWSTVEGQQRFDTHVDKLTNYIRYWQASGESLKTSIRTKTRLGQIVQEGRFRGGTPAYGFRLVKKGRIGKKNRELYDIEINPEEAPAVKRMFDLTDRYGYGGRKISTILKNEGIINLRTGEPFHYSTIQHILANIMNVGILRSGETQSEVFPDLQIIAALLAGFVHLPHGFHTDVNDHSLVYRLCKIFQNAQIDGLFCIAELIISRDHDKNNVAVVLLDLLHRLDPVQSGHLDIHKGNVRPESFRQLHYRSSRLGAFDLTLISEIGVYDISQRFQHDPFVISQHYSVHASSPPVILGMVRTTSVP